MKKLLAVLLALAVVGGAFAQVTTAIGLSGDITLYNQDGQAVFARDGDGYDMLTFKATDKDGKFGFSMTDSEILGGGIVLRDWNAWFKGQFTKVIVGNLRNGDFRMLGATGGNAATFASTLRMTKYGVLVESTTLGALTLGVNLDIPETATDFADMLKMTDVGLSYNMDGVGKLIAQLSMEEKYDVDGDSTTTADIWLDALYGDFGFSYTGMENLTANLLGRVINSADGDLTHIFFNVGADYAVSDALSAGLEFAGANKDAFAWDVYAYGTYTMDKLSFTGEVLYDSDNAYDVTAYVGYDYGNGLSSEVSVGYTGDVHYEVVLYYSVAF